MPANFRWTDGSRQTIVITLHTPTLCSNYTKSRRSVELYKQLNFGNLSGYCCQLEYCSIIILLVSVCALWPMASKIYNTASASQQQLYKCGDCKLIKNPISAAQCMLNIE